MTGSFAIRRRANLGVSLLVGVLFIAACGGGSGGQQGAGGSGGGGGPGTGGGSAGGRGGAGAATDAAAAPDAPSGDAPTSIPSDASDVAIASDVFAPSDAGIGPCVAGAGIELIGAASLRDRVTCLVWQRAAGATLMTNKQAAKYCATLMQDGLAGWRVPAPEELATWPNLAVSDNAFITSPIYVPTAGTLADGCTGNSHSCNLSEYNPGAIACAWQGVGFAGPTVCVRGTSAPGTTAARYAASACDPCKAHVAGAGADFHVADCLPYAN